MKRAIGYLKPLGYRRPRPALDALFHMFAALMAILLPLSLVALAAGVVFRVPDLMAFEIDRRGALTELGIDADPAEIAAEISSFIRHKTDSLTITTQIAYKDVPVFTFMDEAKLDKIRILLDKALLPSLGAFALSIVLFVALRLAGRMRYLKHAMRASAALYACAACFVMALALYAPLRDAVFAWQPGVEFAGTELLAHLYGGLYPHISAVAVFLVSFIIYIALYSVMRRFTIEKETMFA